VKQRFATLAPVEQQPSVVPEHHKLRPIPKRWTPEDRAQAITWHSNGMGSTEIAKRLGYSRFQVIYAVRSARLVPETL
jgi:hypothetical protein